MENIAIKEESYTKEKKSNVLLNHRTGYKLFTDHKTLQVSDVIQSMGRFWYREKHHSVL